ncbi:MAG: Do family serine endopeptidase [Gemmatimonadota bacterium]|nr:Do family serine endopeptidase [Gemmatimonadota bacterium]
MTDPIKTKLIALAVGLACLGMGVVFASTLDWTPTTQATQTSRNDIAPAAQADLEATSNAFTRIADQVTPAVVYVTGKRAVSRGRFPDFGPFDEFFDFPRRRDDDEGERRFRPSGGSGVIVREDGYILTNNHVVEDLEDIRVMLHDRREFDAEIVGRDPSTDLAVLKIDGDDLQPARLAGSDRVRVGEWVLALGNPFGLEFTMTAGIVSAIGRGNLGIISRAENPYAIEDFIQTDAAINPGNSGGPLVNLRGEIVGINTAIASRSGGYQGYGFAIPASIARKVMTQLIETGEVRRAVLGVQIQTVTPLDAEALGLEEIVGVRIDGFTDMEENPAREAGLEENDVVLAVDGEKVETSSELQQAIAFHEPGDEVTLTIWRDGDREEIDVTLGERPQPGEEPEFAGRDGGEAREAALGMEVQNVTRRVRAGLARQFRLEPSSIPDGVFVRDVDPLGPAADAGIPHTAIIAEVGDVRVRNVEEYRSAVSALEPGSVVYLEVYFPVNGQTTNVPIRVPR